MVEKTLDEHTLRQWIGNSEATTDTLHVAQARLMQATLDQEPNLNVGDELPPAWHWTYFLSGVPMSGLGRDGHPALGEFLPPVALPRRMWAGGRLSFIEPVHLGETINKRSEVKDVSIKHGKSGALVFVTVQHEYTGSGGDLRFTEEHDIVYREDPAPDAPAPKRVEPPAQSAYSEVVTPSTVQLFRYSALTFNSHRIHYDREYCQQVEGYPGLIFHGPLTATLLAGLAVRKSSQGKLASFAFRAVAPLYDTQAFTLHHDGGDLVWAETPGGGLAMKAETTTHNNVITEH